MSDLIPLDEVEPVRDRVVDVLRQGRLAVVPADTGYAVLADAFQPAATRRVAAAKRRGREQPLSVLIRSPRQVGGMAADISEAAERLMAAYWPGPLTLVFVGQDGMTWDLGATRGTVALRMPADDLTLAVIAEVGPVACSLACRKGERPASSAQGARRQLGAAVALYVNGGVRTPAPSTVVDVTRGRAEVLRGGAVPAAHVGQVATGEVAWGVRPAGRSVDPAGSADGGGPGGRPDGEADRGVADGLSAGAEVGGGGRGADRPAEES